MVVIRAVIRDRFDEIQSARVLSLMMLVMGAAPILAPLAGGWLLVSGSWHWIFGFLAAFALCCIVLGRRFLEESHPRASPQRARSAARSPACCRSSRDRRFIGPVIVFIAPFGAFFAYLAAAPFVYIQHFGIPAEQFGWYFGAGAASFITVSQLNRRMVARHGVRRVLGWGVCGLAGAAPCSSLFARSPARSVSAASSADLRHDRQPRPHRLERDARWRWRPSASAPASPRRCSAPRSRRFGVRRRAPRSAGSATRGPVPMAIVMVACAAISFLAYCSCSYGDNHDLIPTPAIVLAQRSCGPPDGLAQTCGNHPSRRPKARSSSRNRRSA